VTLGVGHVLAHLPAQGAETDRVDPRLQAVEGGLEGGLVGDARELLPEARQVSEDTIIDEADQSEELQQGILQRRRGEQQLRGVTQGIAQGGGNDVGLLVDVA
jgi:hypothetical protein